MPNLAVIGLQWGDEGKGKLVDWASEHADLVVRFQGGQNAGHTIVIDNKTFKLSQLPSGVLRPGKQSIIGNGVVVEPFDLMTEINAMRKHGVSIDPNSLVIAENAVLVLPVHKELDMLRESRAADSRIGTTGKGIGPAYEDKIGRRALRVGDLADLCTFNRRLEGIIDHHNLVRRGMSAEPVDAESIRNELLAVAPRILPFVGSVWEVLEEARNDDKKILFEGAQGTFLDIDHGTYPFVTSSSTVASNVASGSGVGPKDIGFVLGACKAYQTRVGEGPFPSEQKNHVGERLAAKGHEFGTVTGRPRRCGWFDACMVRKACILSGVDAIALMKLDVLDGLEEVRICTGYKYEGRLLRSLPPTAEAQYKVEAVYESYPGWSEPTVGTRDKSLLPLNSKRFIKRIEQLVGRPVSIVSTSPEREDTINLSRNGIFE